MNKQQILELLVQGKDEASGMLGDVGGSLASLGGVAAGIATGGVALAGAAIVALGAAAVGAGVMIFNFAQDTDTAMTRFGAQVGLAGDELGEFKDVAKDVYAAGLGESIEEVVEQMSLVTLGLGETGEALEDSTRRAMTLADVFQVDVAEGVKWVSSMTRSWKIDSGEAFDVITKGMQMGLDVAGDFGDTLHEYSGDFDRLGFSADQVLSMLNAGLEAGAYNTDVIADGFREMGIRLLEGGDAVTEAFGTMGMNFDAIQASVAAGDETWGDYTENIVEGLLSIESEVERNAAGVAIFGTKWEDLGGDIFLAAGQAVEGIEGIGGATDAAAEQMATGIMPALERLKRTFLTEFEPLGEKAGEVIDKMIPFLEKAAAWLGENVPLAIGKLEEKWERYWPAARDTLVNFWHRIQPGLIWLQSTFQRFTQEFLPRLADAWGILKRGWGEISTLYQTQLRPALTQLWEALGIGETKTDDIGGTFGTFSGILAQIAASGVIQMIKVGIEGIAWAAGLAKDSINWMRGALDSIDGALRRASDMLSWMKDRIWGCIHAFNSLALPDWLTPGSPTPLEIGLVGVGKAFAALPATLPMAVAGGDMGGGGAPGGIVHITNHFGRDSVRSDKDIQRIADDQQRMLELQGLRVRIA